MTFTKTKPVSFEKILVCFINIGTIQVKEELNIVL